MKTIRFVVLFAIIASFPLAAIHASEWETYEVVNRLLSIQGPSAPVIQDDFVIFSADSSLRRVGIAFANENFGTVHWFRQLVVPQPSGPGIQFYIYKIPDHLRELEYRLVVNGLWTVDPSNENQRRDPVSGLVLSVLRLPQRQIRPNPLNSLPDGLTFTYRTEPGEIVTLGGSFNSWDPFMYELREGPAGVYSITIPLPPGTYQYVFFHRGQRHADPFNPRRSYARNGAAASEIIVP
ncbi:MAG: glycogen-binding domain-containing protein [Treponema sp.]|nr:glycogen-binding domain-containing protein [Treponema sp.]